jgi:choline dehydrogenase
MGKVLGGGSSINVMAWVRGHQNDWDYFAAEAGDKSWSYQAVLNIYRRMEDWHGRPDPHYRGSGGLAFVEPSPDPHGIATAVVKGAESVGIPSFDSNNGRMMEGDGGAAICDVRVRNGLRQSAFRAYVAPYLERHRSSTPPIDSATPPTPGCSRASRTGWRASRFRAKSSMAQSCPASSRSRTAPGSR